MKRKVMLLGVAALLLCAVALVGGFEPERRTKQHLEDMREVEKLLAEADVIAEEQILLAQEKSKKEAVEEAADKDAFRVKFECSNGDFVVEVHPSWAPIGAAHFKKAIEAKIYDGARFFRVIPGFMAQFGIPGDPQVAAKWSKDTIKDEPAIRSNTKGMITYAKSGAPNSRTTQLFINYGNNSRLDGMGFAPFGRVIEGMEVVDAINPEYREQPNQGRIESQGNAYLEKEFPRLDYIKTATLLAEDDAKD